MLDVLLGDVYSVDMTDVLGVSHDVIARAKHDLAAAFRAAAMHGFNEGIDNHFSLAVPGRTDLFLQSPQACFVLFLFDFGQS